TVHGSPRDLLSFPTRRSSDLDCTGLLERLAGTSVSTDEIFAAAHARLSRASILNAAACPIPLQDDLAADALPFAIKDNTNVAGRSEEHTSELQSRENLVCRLL